MKFLKKFLKKRRERRFFERSDTEDVFTMIYRTNKWGDQESVSGKGSNLRQTERIRRHLPELLNRIEARSMLDIPCGDFHWMKECRLELEEYIGADIVSELIEENNRKFADGGHRFEKMDLIHDKLPSVDVVLCRDCLVHLCFEDAQLAIGNILRSGIRYVLATTFVNHECNSDKVTGKHRPLNMQKSPFNWPEPVAVIEEDCAGGKYAAMGKSLGLWKTDDLQA